MELRDELLLEQGYKYNPEHATYSQYFERGRDRVFNLATNRSELEDYNTARLVNGKWCGANKIGYGETYIVKSGKVTRKRYDRSLMLFPSGKSTTIFQTTHIEIWRRTKAGALIQITRNLGRRGNPASWRSDYVMEDTELHRLRGTLVQAGIASRDMLELEHAEFSHRLFHLTPENTDGRRTVWANGLLAMPNPRALTEYFFGKSLYRKDLMKAIGHSMGETQSLTYALYASAFKGLVPIDWIINFLRNHVATERVAGYYNEPRPKVKDLRKALLQLHPSSYRRLLKNPSEWRGQDRTQNYIVDILRSLDGARGVNNDGVVTDVRSFKDWHDKLVEARNAYHRANQAQYARGVLGEHALKMREIESAPFKHTQTGIDLTYINGNYVYELPENPMELRDWSAEASNCISGYSNSYRSGHSILATARTKEGKLVACIELKKSDSSLGEWFAESALKIADMPERYKLSQLLGKCNQSLKPAARDAIVSDLNSIGVDTSGHYWGKEVEIL